MVKRENFQSRLSCPNCGQSGITKWSENENPVYGGGLIELLNRFLKDSSAGSPSILLETPSLSVKVVVRLQPDNLTGQLNLCRAFGPPPDGFQPPLMAGVRAQFARTMEIK